MFGRSFVEDFKAWVCLSYGPTLDASNTPEAVSGRDCHMPFGQVSTMWWSVVMLFHIYQNVPPTTCFGKAERILNPTNKHRCVVSRLIVVDGFVIASTKPHRRLNTQAMNFVLQRLAYTHTNRQNIHFNNFRATKPEKGQRHAHTIKISIKQTTNANTYVNHKTSCKGNGQVWCKFLKAQEKEEEQKQRQ